MEIDRGPQICVLLLETYLSRNPISEQNRSFSNYILVLEFQIEPLPSRNSTDSQGRGMILQAEITPRFRCNGVLNAAQLARTDPMKYLQVI